MSRMFFIGVSLLIMLSLKAKAQKDTFIISQDPRIQELLNHHISWNIDNKGKYPGYRLQLHFGQDKNVANDLKTKFNAAYPDVSSYLTWDSPYFKVRVGNYRSYFEAYSWWKKLSLEYPECFIVQDMIEPPAIEEVANEGK